MTHRTVRTMTAMLAIVLLLTMATAPAALAQGKPTKAAFTTASCGTATVQASWNKKLEVGQVMFRTFYNGRDFETAFWNPTPGTSSATMTFTQMPYVVGLAFEYSTHVAIFDPTRQIVLGEADATVKVSCSTFPF